LHTAFLFSLRVNLCQQLKPTITRLTTGETPPRNFKGQLFFFNPSWSEGVSDFVCEADSYFGGVGGEICFSGCFDIGFGFFVEKGQGDCREKRDFFINSFTHGYLCTTALRFAKSSRPVLLTNSLFVNNCWLLDTSAFKL